MMGGSGPGLWWPLMMLMPLVMVAGVVFAAWMLGGVLGFGPRATRGSQPLRPGSQEGGTPEDPLAVVRERYARGEISHDELDSYLDTLLRTDPGVAQRAPGPRHERQG
ncbi:MAG TPA: hypothetical protein VMV92_34200 [Streptosporangiaceae bacterium]|nr:hypothetical protein [Streptosporangiaceae bacterium]